MLPKLCAGILTATGTCAFCGTPALHCRCGGPDRRGPHHGLAEVFLGVGPRGHA